MIVKRELENNGEKMGSGKWGMGNGEWRVGNGKLKMGN